MIPFSFYFSYRITCFYIKTMYYPFKLIKGLFVLFSILPLVLQTALVFHFYFDLVWTIYLHLIINSLIFICFPYYTYLFFGAKKQQKKSIIISLQKNTKYFLKIMIFVCIAYFSHLNFWYENIIFLITIEIVFYHGVKKK